MPQDNEKLGLLYDALKTDEVFSQVVPKDAVSFAKEYSNPEKMRLLYDAIKADEVFKDAVPNTFEETIVEFGLGKPSAEPTKSGGLGSATKEKPQRVELQSQLPTNLSAAANQFNIDLERIQELFPDKNPNEIIEEVSTFGQYNSSQDYFAKVEEAKREIVDNKNPNYSLPQTQEGRQIYLDATSPNKYESLKRQSQTSISNLKEKLDPIINKEVDDSFLTKNEDGFAVPDTEKINQYAEQTAAKYGLPTDGTFKRAVYSQAFSQAQFKAIEPDVNKRFEQIISSDEVKAKLEGVSENQWKGFVVDEIESEKLKTEASNLYSNIKQEAKVVTDEIQFNLQQSVSDLDAGMASISAKADQDLKALEEAYKNQQIPYEEYQAGFEQINQGYKSAFEEYEAQRLGLFDEAQKQLNSANTRYNDIYQNKLNQLNSEARKRIKQAADKYQSELPENSEIRNIISEAYKKAYGEVVKEKADEILKYNKTREVELMVNYGQFGGLAVMADRFVRSFETSLGSSVKALGTSLGADILNEYGAYLEQKFTLPEAKSKEWSDLFDPVNLSQLSGQLAGAMLPSMGAGALAGIATRNAGTATQLAVTGFASFLAESADIAGRMYNDTFDETLSVSKAQENAQKSWDSQYRLLPLYAFSGLPFIETGISKLPLVGRIAAGAAAEIIEEIPQELSQNIAEENIKAGRTPFEDYFEMISANDFQRLKETTISVAPVAILGGAGQAFKSAESKSDLLKRQVQSYAAKAKVNELVGGMQTQWTSDMVSAKGMPFAVSVINALFSEGTIDEQTKNDLMLKASRSEKNLSDAKKLGLNEGEALIYDALGQQYRDKFDELQKAKSEQSDDIYVKALEDEVNSLKDAATNFVKEKQGNFFVFTFEDGSQKIVVGNNWMQDATIVELISNDQLQVSAFSEDTAAQLEELRTRTQPEDIQQQQEGMIEIEQPETPVETIDLTPTPKPQENIDFKSLSVDELEKRQFEIEESKSESDRKLFNDIDKELESREWDSVINAPLSEINGILDFLAEKEKTKPNGFGAYIDKTDARKTREVVDKYSKDVSRKEAIKDFKDAFLGNPSNSYADAIKLRESTRSFIESGGTFKQLLSSVSNEFAQDGFSEQDAAGVINRKLNEISSKNKSTPQENEVKQEVQPEGQQEVINEPPQVEPLKTEENEKIEVQEQPMLEGVRDGGQQEEVGQDRAELRSQEEEQAKEVSHVLKDDKGKRYITKESVANKYPLLAKRLSDFSNSAWFGDDLRSLLTRSHQILYKYKKGAENNLKLLSEIESAIEELDDERMGATKEEVIEEINKSSYNEQQKKILIDFVRSLKRDRLFVFTEKEQFAENFYRFGDNVLQAKSPDSFIHEVGHWAFYNVLTAAERLKFYRYAIDRFYSGENKLGDDLAMSEPLIDEQAQRKYVTNVADNFSEYFAEQFSQYVFSGKSNKELITLFEKLKKYVFELLERFRKYGYNKDLLPFFEKIIDVNQQQAKDEVISKATGTKVEDIKGLKKVLKDVFGLNNMQSDSVAVVMDRMIGAMAIREGVGKDEMYSRVLVANSNEAQQLQDASNIVLQALQDNTVATPINQLAKAFAPFLTQQETADMLSALGETEVNDAAIDKFAKGFEKYLSEGVAPDKSLEAIFKRFQKWLTDIYNGIKGSEIDLALNDKMREIYSAMLGFEVMNIPTQQTAESPAVTMSDAFANLTALAEELKSAAEESVKKKSWSDRANKIADSLDSLIDDIDNSDVAMVGIPFAKQIVVKALKVFRDAFRAGGLTLDAFEAAYNQMLESLNNDTDYNNLSDSDKEEIQNDVSEYLTETVLNNLISGEERKSKTGQRILEGLKSKSDMYVVRKALDDSYQSRSQDDLRKAARVLIRVYGIDKAVRLADDRMMAGDLRGAIYSAAYTEATLAFESDPSPENRKRLTELAKKIKAFGIEGGQQQASMNIIYEDNPEFQIDEFKWNRSKDVKSNLGTKGQQKVQEIINQVPKLKKDLFNALSNVLNGQMDAVELFAKDILADKKIKAGITKLVNLSSKLSNADKTKMSELFAKLRESGKLALEENITEVRQLIIDGLKSINPELQTKLSDSQINDIADEFSKVYSDIANEYLTNQINNAFKDSKKSGQQKKNGQVAKLILQGVLDEFDTMNAFAIKFGIPSLTPQQAQRLKALAQRVNQSTGGQKVAAKNQLNAYLKSLKNQPTTLIGKAYRKLGLIGSDFASYFINNILFGLTAVYALGSNLFRLTTSVMYNAITGETGAIKFAFGNLGSKEILMPDGTTRKVGFSLLKDGFLAAISGIPKLADFMMQGIPLGEMKIRQAKTKAERRARRTFLAASGRLFSAVDAVTVPLYKAMNQYSVLRAFVVQAYRDNDAIPKKGTKEYRQWKLDVDKQVRGLIGLDMTAIDEVAADAMDIVMKGTLVADLIAQGNWNASNPFPTSKDRLRPNSAAAQLYNEFITIMYELIEDGKQGRFLELMNSLDSMGNFLFDQAKNEIYMKDLKDIDKLLAKNTNELSYFGRPPGTAGQIYDVLVSLNNAAPILKYSGYSPIFIGAVCNAAHYAVKTYPVLNAIQYALYKGSGKRGFMREKQFESESNFALRLDQRDMLASVLATTAATIGVASYLLGLYDSDDEEKKALEENRWTGYVNSLTAAQRSIFRDRYGNPLKEGFYYKDGYPMYAVNRTPLFGIFEAAGFWKNTNLFEQSKKTTDLFVDEQENKSFQETLGAYLLNGVLMSAKTASLADLTRSVSSILSAEPTELGGGTSEKIEKDVQNRTARFVSNLIPFNSLQKQIMDAVTSASGDYDKKVASNFYEKVGMNTAFAHYIVKSNLTDMFGRPLAESFDARGLLFGFNTFEFDKDGNISTIVDKVYATDKYMATHIKHNYGYNLRHTSRLPITVTTDGSTLKEAQDEVAKLREQGIEASVPKKEVGTYTTDEVDVIEVIFEIPDESLNLINEQMGKSIKDMFDISGNIEALNNDEITKEGYKRFMDAAYNYARVRATYEMHKEELGDSYKNVVNRALTRLQGNDLVKDGRISLPEKWQNFD